MGAFWLIAETCTRSVSPVLAEPASLATRKKRLDWFTLKAPAAPFSPATKLPLGPLKLTPVVDVASTSIARTRISSIRA